MDIATFEKTFNADGHLEIPPSIFGKYYIKGFLEGYEEGFKIGYEEGFKIGYEEGLKIGYEKGLRKEIQHYISKDPSATDQSVAELFEVDLDFVHKARHSEPL